MESFIDLEEVIELIDENICAVDCEIVSLIDAHSRMVSEDIYSTIDNPPFNKSAMDGYAIKIDEYSNINLQLEVIDTVYAGQISTKVVTEKNAIKIMTGAMIPEGANAVIKQEDVLVEDNRIVLLKKISKNDNVCFKGEDIKINTLVISKGKVLDYADLGIIASTGISEVKVFKRPRVALITTGDEVVDVEEVLKPGKIYNSNKYTILARLSKLDVDITYVDHEADSIKKIAEKIYKATKNADLVLTTGGVSVGEKDLIDEAIDSIGGEILFWKILIKPGSAVLCSKVDSKIVLSLSGNPTAALTTFELLGKTSIEKLSGKNKVEIKREKAILLNEFNKKSIQRRFLRGYFTCDENGQKVTITQIKSGNGILSSALGSNCLIEIEKGSNGIHSGEVVNIIKL